jgi:hypothetical protein
VNLLLFNIGYHKNALFPSVIAREVRQKQSPYRQGITLSFVPHSA